MPIRGESPIIPNCPIGTFGPALATARAGARSCFSRQEGRWQTGFCPVAALPRDARQSAIAMKAGGVDAFYASVDPNTSFSLITAARQAGVDLKAAVLPDGYGADTLQAGPGALQAAQNVYFLLGYEPTQMNTAATRQLVSDLRASGTVGVPTYGEYNGYVSVGLLLRGLKSAGSNPTQASLTTSLSSIHDWDALGLWGGRTADINDRVNLGTPQLCSWVTKLVGSNFQLVSGATPLCGTVIQGVTVG